MENKKSEKDKYKCALDFFKKRKLIIKKKERPVVKKRTVQN